jgi:hypothetical protein
MPRARRPHVSKYAPLTDYLLAQSDEQVILSLAEIEAILGVPLPKNALSRNWWANRQREAQSRAWLTAGRRVTAFYRWPGGPHRWAVTFTRTANDSTA